MGPRALVICPEGLHEQTVGRRVAGRPAGEMLLDCLAAAGVESIGFVGGGERPRRSGDLPEVFRPDGASPPPPEQGFLLLSADLVFDAGVLDAAGDLPAGLPITRLPSSAWRAVLADPVGFLDLLGPGRILEDGRFAVRAFDRRGAEIAGRLLLASAAGRKRGPLRRVADRAAVGLALRALGLGLGPALLAALSLLAGFGSGIVSATATTWNAHLGAAALLAVQATLWRASSLAAARPLTGRRPSVLPWRSAALGWLAAGSGAALGVVRAGDAGELAALAVTFVVWLIAALWSGRAPPRDGNARPGSQID
ncbi:MAG: hypothetical protein R6V85_05040 [Polyangia bacterium]